MVAADPTPDEGDQTTFMSPFEAGVVIGDLELVAKLGEGAQGVVWEARQSTFKRSVAVKLLPLGNIRSSAQVERFKREAEAAGRLNHPHIVGTHEFREWRGQYLIVQELLLGGDLEDEIERRHEGGGSRTDDHQHWSAATCLALAQALHFAHEHGVVHRDIKPGNVLLSEEGVPKLTDFGLAMMEDDRGISRTGVAVGTPYYMSPEQVRAERGGIDHRTDVYSLGTVLYRLLTGHVPFTGKTRQGLLLDILTRDPQPPRKLAPDIDRDLEAVCLKCLEKEPADRYASAQALADDLQRWEQGLGTSARPASMVSLPFRRMRRQATSGLLLLAALVPVAFLAIDLGLLQAAARDDASLHWARQASLGATALMFMWPMAVLGRRLAGGRGWARLPAVALTLAVAALSARAIETQRLDQLQGASRELLMMAASADQGSATRHLLDQHLAQWEPRFGTDDHVAVAYSWLSMKRYPEAAEWTLRTMDERSEDPAVASLQYATLYALGQDDQAAEAEQRMLNALRRRDADSERLLMVGEILQHLGRFDLAEDAYLAAGQHADADRDAIDFALAKLHAKTCRWDEAQKDIEAVMRWRGREVGTNLWAHRIAVGREDWEAAERFLAATERWPRWHFQLQYSYLARRTSREAARDFALETVEARGDDAWLVNAAAAALFNSGWLDEAKRLYERLELLDERSAEARVGLAAILTQVGELDLAEGHARRALEFAPGHDEALYNLSSIEVRRLVAEYGPDDSTWPADAWQRWLDTTQEALASNGLLGITLNNAAYAEGRLYQLTGEQRHLDGALHTIHRAIRQAEPARGSICPASAKQRLDRSRNHDTLSSIHQWAGNLEQAVAAARAALEVLDTGDTKYKLREQRLAALEQELARQG